MWFVDWPPPPIKNPGYVYAGNDSVPRHIHKDVLIRRIIASHLCTPIDFRQFRKELRKLETRISLIVIIPFSISVCCLVVTWCSKNMFWVNQNGGHKQSLGKARSRVARQSRSGGTNYMAMLDFDTTRYCNLVAHKQNIVYINACNGVGRILSWEGASTKGAVSIHIKLFLELAMMGWGRNCKVVGAL